MHEGIFFLTFALILMPLALLVSVFRSYQRIRSYYGRMAPRSAQLAMCSHAAGLVVLCLLVLNRYHLPDLARFPILLGIPFGIFICITGTRYARGDADPRLLAVGILQAVLGLYLFRFEADAGPYLSGIPTLAAWTLIAIGVTRIVILLMGHPEMEEGDAEEFPYGHQVVDQKKAEKSLKE